MSSKLEEVDQELCRTWMSKFLMKLIVFVFAWFCLCWQWFQHPSIDYVCIYNEFLIKVLILLVFTMISTSMCWLWLYLQWFCNEHLDFVCIYNDFSMQVVIMLVFTMVKAYIVSEKQRKPIQNQHFCMQSIKNI